MEGNTELRKLPVGAMLGLVRILESGESWKQLMAIIPISGMESDDSPLPKYKVEHIKLIEQAGDQQKRPCAEIFMEEWGTSGKKRPDLAILVHLLGKAQLFQAADYITELLKAPPLERPTMGPAAPIDVSEETIQKLVAQLPQESLKSINNNYNTGEINRAFDEMSIPENSLPSLDGPHIHTVGGSVRTVGDVLHERFVLPFEDTHAAVVREGFRFAESEALAEQDTLPMDQLEASAQNAPLHLNTTLPQMQYAELQRFTDNFNDVPLDLNGGRKLGTGAFGSVYLGILPSCKLVAVKRLHKDAVNIETQFRNEVEALSRFSHKNLLGLVGYSCDSSTYCLVYEYMSNGSLQDRLSCKRQQEALHWQTRLNIALGTACGILYLHTAYEKPLIHRDIKSANILLDQHLVPKLGDFGLVRLGQHGNTMTMTTTVLGTSAYMAPEAFRGDVSVKLDTFSFGVVLLEILTGLPPYDEEREGHDLVTHVEAMCEEIGSINILLDTRAGDWDKTYVNKNHEVSTLADNLYSVALNCIEDNRQRRPNMMSVVKGLEDIIGFLT